MSLSALCRLRLCRPKLAIMNGIAAAGGYLLCPWPSTATSIGRITVGVTLLAAAGSAVNQVMERDLDLLMTRTQSRPLPQGELTPTEAMAVAGVCLALGLYLLSAGGLIPLLLAGAALACYLGVYTPLKRRTPLALAAGGICGAIPPLIGWCSAGGAITDYRVMLLAGLLYLWQIPHFWLFQHHHSADYRRAGIPLVIARANKGASPTALCRLWIVALLAGSLLLPGFGLIVPPLAIWYTAALLLLGLLSLIGSETILFRCLNFFPLLIPLVLFVQ